MQNLLRLLGACVAIVFLSTSVAGQAPVLQCVTPAEPSDPNQPCTLRAPTYPSQQTLTVRLLDPGPVAGGEVSFQLEAPGGSINQKVKTNPNGEAPFTWTGAAGTATTTITASATRNNRTVRRVIEVKPPLPTTTQRSVLLVSTPILYGYEKRQISNPVAVRVENPGDRCESNVVVFRPYGTVGSGSPDSVRASIDALRGGCTASTYWKLGEGVGWQHLRASLADEPAKSLTLNAVARALPRLHAGIVSTYDFREFETASISERNVQVTRRIVDPVTGDTSVTVADSTVKSISLGEEDGGWLTKPVVSIDFPLRARMTQLRVSLGAAFRDADQDWYLGFSAIQPFRGVSQEAVGADIHAVFHFGRRDVLEDAECDDDGLLDDCRSKNKFFFPMGIGMMATFDASQILGSLGSIFLP